MKIYQASVVVELNATEINGLLVECKKALKYNYIGELDTSYPTLKKLLMNLPSLDLPSQREEF